MKIDISVKHIAALSELGMRYDTAAMCAGGLDDPGDDLYLMEQAVAFLEILNFIDNPKSFIKKKEKYLLDFEAEMKTP